METRLGERTRQFECLKAKVAEQRPCCADLSADLDRCNAAAAAAAAAAAVAAAAAAQSDGRQRSQILTTSPRTGAIVNCRGAERCAVECGCGGARPPCSEAPPGRRYTVCTQTAGDEMLKCSRAVSERPPPSDEMPERRCACASRPLSADVPRRSCAVCSVQPAFEEMLAECPCTRCFQTSSEEKEEEEAMPKCPCTSGCTRPSLEELSACPSTDGGAQTGARKLRRPPSLSSSSSDEDAAKERRCRLAARHRCGAVAAAGVGFGGHPENWKDGGECRPGARSAARQAAEWRRGYERNSIGAMRPVSAFEL